MGERGRQRRSGTHEASDRGYVAEVAGVSKRVNSSRADNNDATLIGKIEL